MKGREVKEGRKEGINKGRKKEGREVGRKDKGWAGENF